MKMKTCYEFNGSTNINSGDCETISIQSTIHPHPFPKRE